MKKVLVAEDEESIREFIVINLTRSGYDVEQAENGAVALDLFSKDEASFDVAILDIMMPEVDGLTVCKELRKRSSDLGIIMLSAKTQEMDKVTGLLVGADDYVTKPFRLLELLSRVRALLRRNAKTIPATGNIVVNEENMTCKVNGQKVYLTPTEYHILCVLLRNRGIIVTRDSLLQSIWDCEGAYVDDNTLSVHISRLREKIGAENIKTVRGVGYRWEDAK